MKRTLILKISALVSVFVALAFLSNAQTTAFKELKKEADTLVIFSPITEIFATDYKSIVRDQNVTSRSAEVISEVAANLLDSRYSIKQVGLTAFDTVQLVHFCKMADSLPDYIPVKQSFLPEFKSFTTGKLGILITYYAVYNKVANPYSTGSIAGESTIMVNLSARPYSELRLIAFNLQTGDIIFHHKYDTRNYSPARDADVETITRKLLRDVYYK